MKTASKDNVLIRAWQIARNEGFKSLIKRAITISAYSIHTHLTSGLDSMEAIMKWLTKHQRHDVYSFDIFDTLLRRRVDPPEMVKRLVAEHISNLLAVQKIHVSADEILGQRNKAEEVLRQEARSSGRDSQCFLEDVVKETLKAVKAENILSKDDIVAYEIILENKATQPMPGAIEVLSHLKSHGKRVVGISETYLSLSQIMSILEHSGLLQYIDRLYISSDIGKGKPSGKLFKHVLENEGSNIVHIGDSYWLDKIVPEKLGIKALWFHSRSEQKRKRELKKRLDSGNRMDYVNAIIGHPDRDRNELFRIGYQVLGPALTVFVHNVAEQARKDGIEMLFFVARDGYAMKKIYEALQHGIYSDSDLPQGKYFCLGRLPVRAASLNALTYANVTGLERYFTGAGRKEIRLGDILASFGLVPTDFIEIAKTYALDISEAKNISDMLHDIRLPKLLESNRFQEKVREKSDQMKSLLREYLVSIGFMGKGHVAVVDANAEGITQSLLDQIFVNDEAYPVVSRYYLNALNLDRNRTDTCLDSPLVKGIVSDWRNITEDEQRPLIFVGMLIELFSHPNHGVTIGYKRADSKVVPVFRRTPQESLYPIASQALYGVLAYARDYSKYYSLHNYSCEELLEDLRRNLSQWVSYPPKRNVEPLRNLFVISDWPQESKHNFIEDISLIDFITIGRFLKKINSSMWLQGTLALAPIPGVNKLVHGIVTYWEKARRLTSRITGSEFTPKTSDL